MVVLRCKPRFTARLVFAWLFCSPVAAGIVNRTIDDSFGDSQTQQLVTYLPSTAGVWKDENCNDCSINPDVSQTFKRTYTAATYTPELGSINATMKFNGTAIYVFFIVANNAGDGITSLTLANFTLDGNPPNLFQFAPDLTSTSIEYNQLVFGHTNLINAEHTLVISTSGVNTHVYVNFDYAIYTHDDDAPLLPLPPPGTQTTTTNVNTGQMTTLPSTTTSSVDSATTSISGINQGVPSKPHVSTGATAGGIIGGLILLVLLILFLRRWRRKNYRGVRNEGANFPPSISHFSQSLPIPTSTSVPLAGIKSPASTTTLDILSSYKNTSSSLQSVSTSSEARTSTSYLTGPLRQSSVANSGDTLTTEDAVTGIATTPSYPNYIDLIKRTRQNEIDQQLHTVQQEMMYLTSDLRSEEKGRVERRSVRRNQTLNRGSPEGAGDELVEEGEISMADMKEQLRTLREQIDYLQDQHRSAWAQGLSDDPPPGYTPAIRQSHLPATTDII